MCDGPPILQPSDAAELRRCLAKRPRGLLTDVDGTISPIAPSPQEARVSPAVRASLQALRGKFELVAVVSGRGVEDLRRLVGVLGLVYIGNHGLERWEDGEIRRLPEAEAYIPVMNAVRLDLASHLGEGIIIEDKGASLSVHYRRSPYPQAARQQILDAVSRSRAARCLRLTEGRMVVELRPPLPVDKGTALLTLVEEYALHSVIYLGDDLTDVDAFQAVHRLGGERSGLAVAVVGEETALQVEQAADLTLPGVEAAEQFLSWLASCL